MTAEAPRICDQDREVTITLRMTIEELKYCVIGYVAITGDLMNLPHGISEDARNGVQNLSRLMAEMTEQVH